MTFEKWVETFPWESEAQKKGYLAMIQNTRGLGIEPVTDPHLAFLIQKNHEAHVWWSETVGEQISQLRAEIRILQERLDFCNSRPDVRE